MIRRTTTTDEYLDISRRGPPRLSLYFRIALKPKVLFVAADDLGCDFIATSMTQVGLGMYNLQVCSAHNSLPVQSFTTASFDSFLSEPRIYYTTWTTERERE